MREVLGEAMASLVVVKRAAAGADVLQCDPDAGLKRCVMELKWTMSLWRRCSVPRRKLSVWKGIGRRR